MNLATLLKLVPAASHAFQGNFPGAAAALATAVMPYGFLAWMPFALGRLLAGKDVPEHIGFNMMANVPMQVLGQDDQYIYFMPKASLDWPEKMHLTEFRINKQSGDIEYKRAAGVGGLYLPPGWGAGPEHEGAISEEELARMWPGRVGYGDVVQWVPFEGIIEHGGERLLVDPNAFSIRLYHDVLVPAGAQALWPDAPPPSTVSPSQYQWISGIESEAIPADVAASINAALAAGVVPELIPFYLKLSNKGAVQGAYGLVPVGQPLADQQQGGVFDMANDVLTPQGYMQFLQQLMGAVPGLPTDYYNQGLTYLDTLIGQLPQLGPLSQQWMDAINALIAEANRKVPNLKIGAFSIVPDASLARKAQNIAALVQPLGPLGEMIGEVLGTQKQRAAVPLEMQKLLGDYYRDAMRSMVAASGILPEALADIAAARLSGEYGLKATKAGQPPDWARLLTGAPYALSGLFGLSDLFGSIFGKGLFDWLGGSLKDIWSWFTHEPLAGVPL